MKSKAGFTLLELSIATGILTVVSLLTFIVTQSTTSAVAVADAKEQAQASVRDTLNAMASELQLAAKVANPALVPPLNAVSVVNPGEIVFQIPVNSTGSVWSTPIRYRFVNEDASGPGAENARLDDGEDADGDGALTRHIVRIQDGVTTVLGAANDLSLVQFVLSPNADEVTITLSSTKTVNNRRFDLVRTTAVSRVYLCN